MTDTVSVTPTPAPAADSALTPAAADLLQPQQMTPEVAAKKKVEYLGDLKFRDRVARGDPDSVRAWREVTRALTPQANPATAEGKQYNDNMNSLAILRAKADLSDLALDHAAARGPISLKERQDALFAKERNFKDLAWVQRYLSGDRQANSEAALIHIALASPIGSFEEIEAFKKTPPNDWLAPNEHDAHQHQGALAMVTKSAKEIDEMRWLISQGLLPKDAIEQHVEHEYQQTFGQDYKTDADGNVIEQGRGSKAQPTRGSIDAYIKNQTERRRGGPEKGYAETLQRMEDDLAAFNANKPAPAKRRPARPANAA